MKPYLILLLSVGFCSSIYGGGLLQKAKISAIVSSAVPSYIFVGGDSDWSGGVGGNGDMDNSTFESNTAFLILELKPTEQPNTAKEIAEKINGHIIQHFSFPKTSPSSTWIKKQPKGTTEESFGGTFLKTYPQDNDLKTQAVYLTVQVVKLDDSRFGVTITYVNRER